MIGQDVASVADNLMGKLGGIMGIILVVVGVLLLAVFLPWFYFGCGRPKVTKDCVKRVFAPDLQWHQWGMVSPALPPGKIFQSKMHL